MSVTIDSFLSSLGYQFVNKNLLTTALTHRSFRVKTDAGLVQAANYERLEFLGDAVLELIITEYLYQRFEKNEGELTAIRSHLVNRHVLARIGHKLGLEQLIRISEQEKAELGKARDSIVADAVEALIGALYTEAGYETTKNIMLPLFLIELEQLDTQTAVKDPKTELQELAQKELKVTPIYKTLQSRGKDHQKEFETGLYLGNRFIAKAWGKSKQEAQTETAKIGLSLLKEATESATDHSHT